jgi:hypothetical protein
VDAGHDTEQEIWMMRRNVAFLGTAVIVVSAAVNVMHPASHAGQHLRFLPAWQLAYFAIVIYAAPVVAASMLWIRYRPLLFSIAHRMLGSVAYAEDVVQEAYLRWQRASDVRSQKAYLSTVVTRLFLDHLRTAPPGFVVRRMRINGRLGLVGYFEEGSLHSVTTLDVAGDKVRAIRLVVNPEKLGCVLLLDRAEIMESPR